MPQDKKSGFARHSNGKKAKAAGEVINDRLANPSYPGKQQTWHLRKARELWVISQLTVTETCLGAQITPTTLRRWRNYHGWDAQRRQYGAGYVDLLAAVRKNMALMATALEEQVDPDAEKIAANNKVLRGLLDTIERIRKVEENVDYRRLGMRWGKQLVGFITERDGEAAAALEPHLAAFLNEIVRG